MLVLVALQAGVARFLLQAGEATIVNAYAFFQVPEEHGGFDRYVWFRPRMLAAQRVVQPGVGPH